MASDVEARAGDQRVWSICLQGVPDRSVGSGNGVCFALGPMAVRPDRQGEGIGGALVRAALAGAGELGWPAVFLVGDPAYYVRFGFELAAPRGFTYGHPHFDPVLQVAVLTAGALDGRSGRVCFHPAFADHE